MVMLYSRRNFLKTILDKDNNELVNKMFNAQKNYPVSGDFAEQDKQDLIKAEIYMDENDIIKVSKLNSNKKLKLV